MPELKKFTKTDDVIERQTASPSEREQALIVAGDMGRALGRNIIENHGEEVRRIFDRNNIN